MRTVASQVQRPVILAESHCVGYELRVSLTKINSYCDWMIRVYDRSSWSKFILRPLGVTHVALATAIAVRVVTVDWINASVVGRPP